MDISLISFPQFVFLVAFSRTRKSDKSTWVSMRGPVLLWGPVSEDLVCCLRCDFCLGIRHPGWEMRWLRGTVAVHVVTTIPSPLL